MYIFTQIHIHINRYIHTSYIYIYIYIVIYGMKLLSSKTEIAKL